MPGPLSPERLARYADPAYLSREAPAAPTDGEANWMHRIGLPGLVAGQAADAGTTIAALRNPALQEGNSGIYGALPSPGRVIGTKAAALVPLAWWLDHVYDHAAPGSGVRKAALLGSLAVGALGGGLAAHNVGMLRKTR